ncbi:MAG: hypothetical protein S4CHLAM37_00240 [Chlamydiia bacterium]|nr:hypothetical protein [Chlamydiia bacterium]
MSGSKMRRHRLPILSPWGEGCSCDLSSISYIEQKYHEVNK